MGSSNNLLIDITSISPIFLLDIVLRLQGEILSWSIMGVKGSVLPPKKKKSTKTRNAVVVKKLSKCHNTIYDFHIFTTVYSPRHKFIWNQHIDQLPVGLLAQLVEHCTGISEVHWSNPIQA